MTTTTRTESETGRSRLTSYLLIRLTGLALAVLVIGHLAVTHVVTDVADTDAGFVARHWGSALWITWDVLMLAAALCHAGAGLWIAIDDYARTEVVRRRLRRTLIAISVALLALGTFTIARSVYA